MKEMTRTEFEASLDRIPDIHRHINIKNMSGKQSLKVDEIIPSPADSSLF